jgi:hypothetical protein
LTPGLLTVCVVCLLSFGSAPSDAAAPVLLSVSPQVSSSPGTFRATATLQRHSTNRRLVLAVDSALYFRSSTIELEGEDAPVRHVRTFGRLPAGVYEVTATLVRSDGSELVDRLTARVAGR